MALQTVKDWTTWLTNVSIEHDVALKYAKELYDAEITEEDLSELTHELLKEVNIIKPGHRTKILKKAKESKCSSSTTVTKSDVKLPNLSKNCTPSQFRKFIVDWNIYKSEKKIHGIQCNKLLYCACAEDLQCSVINGMPNFLESTEEVLLDYIKSIATQSSNPTVYRLFRDWTNLSTNLLMSM